MTKYKLTTDLISDCMALIPQNLERLNKPDYSVEIINKEIYVCTPSNKYFIFGGDFFYKDYERDFVFACHCLRTIPEFQRENPEYAKTKWQAVTYTEGIIWETIASATLHGQGEFPPSTLEELVESYKNVMSK